ncbi:hypothetical protein [Lignipirellula cremea]|uniref:hypothetical protein n=1 Tax=Lignipirellula cremea TaxID=2528010 RepID=UPI0011A77309|nr:hypothetical protein [Lignipirellula cremea]
MLWVLALLGTAFWIVMICLMAVGVGLPALLSALPGVPNIGAERALVRSSERLNKVLTQTVPRAAWTGAAANRPAPESMLAWQTRSPFDSHRPSSPFQSPFPNPTRSPFIDSPKSTSTGGGILAAIVMVIWVGLMIAVAFIYLLMIRMFLETLTVVFNIANTLTSIEQNLRNRM